MTIKHQIGPFAIVPLWLHKALVAEKTPQALNLYIALHEWTAGDDRTAHPARLTLAARCGVAERTIDAWIKALVAVGALQVEPRYSEHGDRTSNDYTLLVAPPGAVERPTPGAVERPTGGAVDCSGTIPTVEPDPLEPDSLVPAVRERKRNPTWDALVEACGVDVDGLTRTALGNVGKTVKELNEIGATPDEIFARAAIYRRKFPDAALTVQAFRKHWPELTEASVPRPTGRRTPTTVAVTSDIGRRKTIRQAIKDQQLQGELS